MEIRNGRVKVSYEELKALHDEDEGLLRSLRDRVVALEGERDQALNGLDELTKALRRRGCCDGH